MYETAEIIAGLREFDRLPRLFASRFYSEKRSAIERILETPLVGGPQDPGPAAAPVSLRAVQWNIEKGLRFDGIARALERHPDLAGADLILLNEVDLGMARSGNLHVARELAGRLGFFWAFAPAHIELTKGAGADLDAVGENTTGLQGNAVLSRYPILQPRVVGLPVCFEPYHFHEKRFGRRVGLVGAVRMASVLVTFVSTHLEVRNTPGCRARQMRALVQHIPNRGPALIAGDLNCSTFSRGNFARTVRGTARLFGDVDRLREALRNPVDHEPLFAEMRAGGFRTRGWNTADPTIAEQIGNLEDAHHLPGPVRRAVLARMDRLGNRLDMRLDWFAGRDLLPAEPKTISGITGADGERVSDHDPITVTIHAARRKP